MGKIFLCRGKQDCGNMKRGAIRRHQGAKNLLPPDAYGFFWGKTGLDPEAFLQLPHHGDQGLLIQSIAGKKTVGNREAVGIHKQLHLYDWILAVFFGNFSAEQQVWRQPKSCVYCE